MKAKPLEIITRHWSISGTNPFKDQAYPHYGENFHIGVTAKSMEEALAAVRLIYEKATFHSCHNLGDIHIQK